MIRSATAIDLPRSCVSSSSTANSSPPRRHGEVVLAQDAADPLGDVDQQAVAGSVTEGVVDDLEVVEVEEQDRRHPRRGDPGAPVVGASAATPRRSATRSTNRLRLASPVSGSW